MGYDVETGEKIKANCVESVRICDLKSLVGFVYRKEACCSYEIAVKVEYITFFVFPTNSQLKRDVDFDSPSIKDF